MTKVVRSVLFFLWTTLLIGGEARGGAQLSADLSTRFDYRSESGSRYQYRIRAYPSYQFNDNWQLQGFIVSGDEFSSSHNTINASKPDYLYVRRLFASYMTEHGRLEVGILPTFKGRVSSTGLSKDGWIGGVRYVHRVSNGQVEAVIGQLDDLSAARALNLPDKANYFEFEYSFDLSKRWSAELGLERMLDDNFVRTELRYHPQTEAAITAEWVYRPDIGESKVALGWEQSMLWFQHEIETNTYYAYVNEGFGGRAELTEDFLNFGHALALEVKGKKPSWEHINWFGKAEFYEGESRLQAGIRAKF